MRTFLVTIILMLAPFSAKAMQLCGSGEEIVRQLKEKHGENLASIAFNSVGHLVQRFQNPQTGTWTIVSFPDPNYACIRDHGTEWYEQNIQPKPQA